MSARSNRKRKNQRKGNNLRQRAQQNLEKGNVRQALKDARVCYRTEATEPHRRLLEQALAARAEELLRSGAHEQGRNVVDELVKLGPTDPEIQSQLPRWQVLLGCDGSDASPQQAELLEANPQLLPMLADEAVLRPQVVATAGAEIKQGAQAIVAALKAIEQGDGAAASEPLTRISRQSPFADWKMFTRGLSAFYARDQQRARANWERLDPQRAAWRIAQTLLVASGQLKQDETPLDVGPKLPRLQRAAGSDAVCGDLKSMSSHWQAGRMNELLRSFRTVCSRWAESHPELLEKATDTLWKCLVREGRASELVRLSKTVPAPRLDPRWNRAHALLAELSAREGVYGAQTHWLAYIADLEEMDCLPKPERDIAVALVYQRLARQFRQRAEHARPMVSLPRDDWRAERLRDQAADHYQSSLHRCPRLLDSHRELVSLYLEGDAPDDAVKASQHLLEQCPEDFETLVWLANHHLEMDQPGEAEKYADDAYRVKPRDPATAALRWNQKIGMVRHCTRKRKFQLARQELEAAAEMAPRDTEPYWLDVIRATIEYKAQNQPEAERHLDAARSHVDEPTCIWLMMHSTAVRYGLGREIKNDFRDRFKSAVAEGASGQTAGHMARFLLQFLVKKTKYTGLATHQRLVLTYLDRCDQVQWQQRDLRHVCEFLNFVEGWKHRELRQELLQHAMRQFPEDPLFPLLFALLEMENGPFMTDVACAMEHLERALNLNENAELRLDAHHEEVAKRSLASLDAFRSMAPSFMAYDDDDDDEDDEDDGYFDDYYDEDDEDDDSWGPPPTPFPDELDESTLAAMVPPGMFAEMKAYGEQLGLDIVDLLQRMARGEIDMREAEAEMEAAMSGGRAAAQARGRRRKSPARR